MEMKLDNEGGGGQQSRGLSLQRGSSEPRDHIAWARAVKKKKYKHST